MAGAGVTVNHKTKKFCWRQSSTEGDNWLSIRRQKKKKKMGPVHTADQEEGGKMEAWPRRICCFPCQPQGGKGYLTLSQHPGSSTGTDASNTPGAKDKHQDKARENTPSQGASPAKVQGPRKRKSGEEGRGGEARGEEGRGKTKTRRKKNGHKIVPEQTPGPQFWEMQD